MKKRKLSLASGIVLRGIPFLPNLRLCVWLCISFSFFSSLSCKEKQPTIDKPLLQSVQWMWSQQSADGGWHSKTHAVLRDGTVLTPYILYHLLQVPKEVFNPTSASVENAVSFIENQMRASLDEDSTRLIDYPNYSAGYAVRVLHYFNRDTALQKIIVNYLRGQQFIEQRGFTSDSLVYGGWGYGEPDLRYGTYGHIDISHTRRIVEALFENKFLDASLKNEIKEQVITFIKGVQRTREDDRLYEGCISRSGLPYDGGFVSSAVTLSTNKSQPVQIEYAGVHYPSYATATCDGFLTMHALRMQDEEEYDDALKWLLSHQNMSTIDGLEKEDPEQWAEIMHYYHLSVRSEAMSIIEPGGIWVDSIASILVREQFPEGYYTNPIGGVNKEDDPLMATILCIQAGIQIFNFEKISARN